MQLRFDTGLRPHAAPPFGFVARVALAIVLASSAACASATGSSSPPMAESIGPNPSPSSALAEQLEEGERIYGRTCDDCHGMNGEGGASVPPIIPLRPIPLPPSKTRNAAFVHASDVEGFVQNHMPQGFEGLLTREGYWAVTAFVLHRGGFDLHGKPLDATTAPSVEVFP